MQGYKSCLLARNFLLIIKETLMTKFTKISAAALFALFLTACDKPAEKKAEAPAPAKAEMTQTQETPKAEETKPAAEQPKAEITADAQAVEDLKKFIEWKQVQEQTLTQAQNDLQQGIATQDKVKAEDALAAFKGKVDEVLKSLDAVEIKNEEVKAFKAQARESLVLSNDLIAESVKAMSAPSPELQSAIQEKAQKLMQLGADLQQKQMDLQKKYLPQ